MSLLRETASYLHHFSYETLSPREVEIIKACLCDWLAVALSGSREEVTLRTRAFAAPAAGRAARGAGQADRAPADSASVSSAPAGGGWASGGGEAAVATILGSRQPASLTAAAFVNGVAGHALDYDDVTTLGSGHPSAPVMPVVLALGEELGSSGRDALAAMVAGFAVELGLGLPIMPGHYDRGHHNTATMGRLGAAAAASVLRHLRADQCEAALGIAATTSAGLRAGFGTMLKSLQVGWAAMGGLIAEELARSGVTGADDILEGKNSLYKALAPSVDAEAVELLHRAMKPGAKPTLSSYILDSVLLKGYPSCWSTHGAIICALEARPQVLERGGTKAIKEIKCVIHPQCLKVAADPAPTTGLAAKFSAQYCAALALVDGRVRLDSFTDEKVNRPEVVRLGRSVTVVPEEAYAKARDCVLTLTMTNGETITTRTRIFRPTPAAELWQWAKAKLEEGCELAFGSAASAAKIADTVAHFEDVGNVRELASLLRQAAKE